METIRFTDPRNEMVLFRFDNCWEALGPVRSEQADAAVNWFVSKGIPAFICLDEEFEQRGKPEGPEAKNYFYKPMKWWFSSNCENPDTVDGQLLPETV